MKMRSRSHIVGSTVACLLGMFGLMWAGCAPLTLEQRIDMRKQSVRVCIRNETSAMGNLRGWVEGHGRQFDVMSGHEQCRDYRATGRTHIRVYVETIGGSMWGPTQASATFPVRKGGCWDWEVRNNMSEGAILQCRRGSAKWGL